VIEVKPLQAGTVAEYVKKIALKENIQRDATYFQKIAIKAQGDMRAALNDLHAHSYTEALVDTTERRDVEESIFSILRRLFKERSDFLTLFDNTKLSLDEILLWIEENIPREYKNEALAKAYLALGKADVFRGRIYRNQFWRFLIYQNIFQSAGIAYAKNAPNIGFTSYQAPKRIFKIWQNNQKIAHKKSIAYKYAHLVHCSEKRALRDFELIKLILKRPSIKKQVDLSEEEQAYLEK
jgi:replication factor C large subunit